MPWPNYMHIFVRSFKYAFETKIVFFKKKKSNRQYTPVSQCIFRGIIKGGRCEGVRRAFTILIFIYIYMAVSRLLCDPNGAPRKLAHKLSNLPRKLKSSVCIFFGCGLRRQKVVVFYKKMTVPRYSRSLFTKMLEFPVGVACGAKKLLYVTPKVTCWR